VLASPRSSDSSATRVDFAAAALELRRGFSIGEFVFDLELWSSSESSYAIDILEASPKEGIASAFSEWLGGSGFSSVEFSISPVPTTSSLVPDLLGIPEAGAEGIDMLTAAPPSDESWPTSITDAEVASSDTRAAFALRIATMSSPASLGLPS